MNPVGWWVEIIIHLRFKTLSGVGRSFILASMVTAIHVGHLTMIKLYLMLVVCKL